MQQQLLEHPALKFLFDVDRSWSSSWLWLQISSVDDWPARPRHMRATQKAPRPERYTGAGASGRHPRPRKGLRPPRHRSCRRQRM